MQPFSQDSARTQESSSKDSANHHEYNNEIPDLGVRGRAGPGRRPRHRAAARGRQERVRRHPAGAGGREAGAVHSGGEGHGIQAFGPLLRGGEGDRGEEPRVPLRGAALQDRASGRGQAGGGHHHPQALRPDRPPHRLQVRQLHHAQPAAEGLIDCLPGSVTKAVK